MVGRALAGDRRIVPVRDGTFEGERLRGTVLGGGSDWIVVRPDEVWELNVRLTLKTDDDQLIAMSYQGRRHGPAEVLARLNRGEEVDPRSYYFRTAVLFETASEKYAWINRIIAIGTGSRRPEGPVYEVFEIL